MADDDFDFMPDVVNAFDLIVFKLVCAGVLS
jgi:hypothetical protein